MNDSNADHILLDLIMSNALFQYCPASQWYCDILEMETMHDGVYYVYQGFLHPPEGLPD